MLPATITAPITNLAPSGFVSTSRLDAFMAIYEPALLRAVSDAANGYRYGPDQVPGVVAKMRAALEADTFNHDGKALAATCRILQIKHSRTAIRAYLRDA